MNGFVTGTLVHTDRGLVPIERLGVDDRVLSRPADAQGAAEYRRVARTIAAHVPIVSVSFQADKEADRYKAKYARVFSAHVHPFWIEQVGWTPAQDVNHVEVIGALFGTADGGQTPTGAVNRIYRTDRPEIGWEATLGVQSAGELRDFSRGGAFLESGVYYDVERWAPGEGDDDLYAGVWVRGAWPHTASARHDPAR